MFATRVAVVGCRRAPPSSSSSSSSSSSLLVSSPVATGASMSVTTATTAVAATSASATVAAATTTAWLTTPTTTTTTTTSVVRALSTTSRTPTPSSASDFSSVTDADIAYFRRVCGDTAVETDAAELASVNVDWMRRYRGASRVAVAPDSVERVAAVLRHCNARRLAVVPQGGNTGLVGGAVPVADEVVLSTARLNRVRSFDALSGVVETEAGVVLATLDDYVRAHGHCMPLDLGAKGSCHIGGNLSTHAGGLHVIRYGVLRGAVVGVEAVLADGRLFSSMSSMRKDNTGYDLKQLLIGAEGTLGVITAAKIVCPPTPREPRLAFLGCRSVAAVMSLLRLARARLGETLYAFEVVDATGLHTVVSEISGARAPLADVHAYHVLVEVAGADAEHDAAKLDAFLAAALDDAIVDDGTVAADGTQRAAFWRLRESVAEACGKRGAVYKYDISLPTAAMFDIVGDVRRRLRAAGFERAEAVGYGHAGDGNLHLNVFEPGAHAHRGDYERLLEPWVFEWVHRRGGSISAEHGVGRQKRNYLHFAKDDTAVALMRQIKCTFDPNGILNPYKVLPDVPGAR